MTILKAIAGLFAFAVLILALATTGCDSHQPHAIIDITAAQMNDSCTVFGDYCVRAVCTYYNRGDAAGQQSISARLFKGSETVASRESNITLMPGNAQTISFDFQEAILDDADSYQIKCYK